jgi:glycosyltransferase involved in cell wall biosynthesis
MRIVIVSRFYPPDTGGGGIAAYARYAAVGLTRAGHQVKVISAMAEGSKAHQILDGVDIYRIMPLMSNYFWTRLPIFGRQMRFVRDLAYAWRVRQILLKIGGDFHPDIVEYADIDAESTFHPLKLCPYVVKLHTPHAILQVYYTDIEFSYARRSIEWLEAKAIKRATGISSPSLYLAGEIERTMNIADGQIKYVPNFIDTDLFFPLPTSSVEQPFSVLYVGRLEPRKGAIVFAEALPFIAGAVPKAKFIFVGADRASRNGSSQQADLRQFFEQANLQRCVEFHDHASSEVFLSFYRRASIFVLPSLFENSPYTLLEAMACGKACVVSRAGGMPEIAVEGVSGLFFESGNPQDLAEKVIGLLKDPERRKSLGRAARLRAEQEYGLNAGVEKTLAFYNAVLQKEQLGSS